MKKVLMFVIAIFVSTLFSGCGTINRFSAKITGSTEECVDRVIYLQFPSGASVKYKPDGSIATCK